MQQVTKRVENKKTPETGMETLNEDGQGSGLCDASTLGPSQTLKHIRTFL